MEMPRPRPPFLHYERLRHQRPHGQGVWYFRKGQGPRIRIRAPYGSSEFMEEYQRALTGDLPAARKRVSSGTLEWAVNLYKQSTAWQALSKATRRQRDNIFKRIVRENGDVRIGDIEKEDIIMGRERRAATPAAARNYLEAMRGLCDWAYETNVIQENPCEGVKAHRIQSAGFPIWTEVDIQTFEARWPVGTRPRVAFDLLRFTGLRRGDACRLGKPHVKNWIARIATEKSKFKIWVAIPLAPELIATLQAGPCGELTFIAGEHGRPLTKESFGNYFRDACRAAGLNKSAHGLRKVRATEAAEQGYTNLELDAALGWTLGSNTSKDYVNKANREKLSLQAAFKACGK